MSTYDNIYISTNPDRKKLGKSKYGYVKGDKKNLANRLSNSSEQFSDLTNFTHIFTFKKTDKYKEHNIIDKLVSYGCRSPEYIKQLEEKYNTTLPNMREISQYLVEGTNQFNEFINDEGITILMKVLKDDFPKLGLQLVKEFSIEEIAEINNMGREIIKKKVEEVQEKFTRIMNLHKLKRTRLIVKWDKRTYQQEIIETGNKIIRDVHKLYLELATGGGKSYSVYNLLKSINSNTIIIFSPRKKINVQNVNNKYLSILDSTYHTFNYSNDTNLEDWLSMHKDDKKIIIACTQSQEMIYDVIIEKKLQDISIWFDESHWSIEKWIDIKTSSSKQFFMNDKNIIKKRIFTSASPDKDKIALHPDVFGKLYCPIKVKELIGLKWLCPIEPRILKYNRKSLNLSDWIIDEFSETNSHYGFSFHSRDNNAFNLFYQHFESYNDGITLIKPYLLIDNVGLNDDNKKKLEKIVLDYNFRSVDDFEVNANSIGYTVQQFTMGYDFAKLDYLVFSDPKMSLQDIIQCIGRGTRPDGLGENGKNLNKILNVMLPVYIQDDESSYKNIIEVLRYLVLDLDVDILEDFIQGQSVSLTDKKGRGVDYGGEKNNGVLLDLIYQRNILERPTTKILYRFCRKYGIGTEEAYNRFKLENSSIPLKDNIYEYNGFTWKNVMDPDGEIYYGNESDIEKAEDKIVSMLEDEEEEEFYAEREEKGWIVSHRYDPKIPPMKIGQLEHYY